MNILIIGGTGSLGVKLLEYYYDHKNIITIFSRDELKQSNLKKKFPSCRYVLGDIRDQTSLENVFEHSFTYDVVFLCAALKHVDLGEDNVDQFVKTNYHGVVNVHTFCKIYCVQKLVYFTTDKAVMPVNAYGMSKALGERYLQQQSIKHSLDIYVFRWGNILGSRGSALDYFVDCLKNKKSIKVTRKDSTRFWLLLDEVIQFVNDTIFDNSNLTYRETVYIPKMKASSIEVLLKALYSILENKDTDLLPFRECYQEVGLRPGEKVHEHITPYQTSENSDQFGIFELMKKLERLDIW